ncbi:MAG: hypothetical protein LBP19_06595 [Treponema sp.]|jgi:hypothetical protein|nr:hypothetical protein [Treponema sp.]
MIREPIIHSNNTSFETILDETCERLLGKKGQYSITRLVQMEADLIEMEKELDTFLQHYKMQ